MSENKMKRAESLSGDNSSVNNSDDSVDASRSHVTGTSTTSAEDASRSLQEEISKQETKVVFRLRLAVILVLIAAAATISAVVYMITRKAEFDEFEGHYEAAAQKIVESFEDIVHQMGSVSAVGVALTAHSMDHEADWPYLTLSNFQQRAGNARHLSGALLVEFAPFVKREDFEGWDSYVIDEENNAWIDDAHAYQKALGIDDFETEASIHRTHMTDRKVDLMHYFDHDGHCHREELPSEYYLPVWQTSPYLQTGLTNENILRQENVTHLIDLVVSTEKAVFGGFHKAPAGTVDDIDPHTAQRATLRSMQEHEEVTYLGDPVADFYIPVFDSFNVTERKVTGILVVMIHWRAYFRKILPSNSRGVVVVLDHECGGSLNYEGDLEKNGIDSGFTYQIDGSEAHIMGYGDHHDDEFNKYMKHGNLIVDDLDDGTLKGIGIDETCSYDIHVFPSQTFYDNYNTKTPYLITFSMVICFLFTTFMFLFYDRLVERRQKLVLMKATQSTAIVSSLFPKSVMEKLMEGEKGGGANFAASKTRLKGFLNGEGNEEETTAAPIADLFPHCTVFFGDIAGFTAWSSTREPSQVFILLQTVYQAFDRLAKRRRVFKVETIGDSYMAVTGLPDPQVNHATNMVRFAWDCLEKMNEITRELESTLGPDTGDLGMRFGVHSGPVTAGVLRGDRARFQLFGDTVNTASRMESTGQRGKIQVSSSTAVLLKDAGKEHWLVARDNQVLAKGKGVMKTFWANPHSQHSSKDSCSTSDTSNSSVEGRQRKTQETKDVLLKKTKARLVDWMVKLLLDDIKKIVHARNICKVEGSKKVPFYLPPEGNCMDEVQPFIRMPEFNAQSAQNNADYKNVVIDDDVIKQLTDYVTVIASMYRNNPFHNFDHACHVTMSVSKLLGRIVAPDLTKEQIESLKGRADLANHLHSYTHGLNSCPLTMLAITFSALIHDVDHRGVSNGQLIVEEPQMAALYRNKSIAEQNSLDVAWDALMQDHFKKLRSYIFNSQEELMRFRQLIVNVVLATDIFDKELNDLRRARWEKAFSSESDKDVAANKSDLRATIVLEHIIQASDVSHTMQHWHVYQKWNKKLFFELSAAFHAGRLGKDPATFWYQGELGFFDNYIIPLAGKLKDCGVFGVSSDEYLNYALQNRAEWEERGKDLVNEFVGQLETADPTPDGPLAAAERRDSKDGLSSDDGMSTD